MVLRYVIKIILDILNDNHRVSFFRCDSNIRLYGKILSSRVGSLCNSELVLITNEGS